MIKIFYDNRQSLHKNLIKSTGLFEECDNPEESDIIISQKTVTYPEFIEKIIYISAEPPRTKHRKWCYDNYDNFKLAVCHNPDLNKKNQIPFTPDNSAQFYPYVADAYILKERNDTTIKTRGVFFAGNINRKNVITPDYKDSYNISHLRYIIGDYLIEKSEHNKFIGVGWNNQIEKTMDWRRDKMAQIEKSNCDFVLALENTIYPNYLSEKISDGINSDRVTLYLGDTNIEQHIPLNCFIDMRPYYDTKNRIFNIEDFYKKIQNMTQIEYDKILFNAREYKKNAFGKHRYYMDLLTNRVMEFIIDKK